MMNVLTTVQGLRYCAAVDAGVVLKVVCLAEAQRQPQSLGTRSHQTACRRGHWRVCIRPPADRLHTNVPTTKFRRLADRITATYESQQASK